MVEHRVRKLVSGICRYKFPVNMNRQRLIVETKCEMILFSIHGETRPNVPKLNLTRQNHKRIIGLKPAQ